MILHDHGSGGKRKASLVREKRETMAFLQNGGQPFAVSAEQASGTKELSPKVYNWLVG